MKITSLPKAALILSALAAGLASAATKPVPTEHDSRIQYVLYNPDDVVVIKTYPGNTTLVQLEEGEYAVDVPSGGLSIGDKGAWDIALRGHNLFLKPTGVFPDTNINLVTNKRTYALALVESPDETRAAWQVRFRYPSEPVDIAFNDDLTPARALNEGPCSDGPKNYNWFKYGDQALAPTAVWDDGRFTCLQFPTSKALPAIYRHTPENKTKEALVNFHVSNDIVVVHEVAEEFRLRIGERVLGIKTDSLRNAPFNHRKTTTGETRVRVDE